MTKREVVWLIVKLIGVYFIYEALISAWSGIGSFLTIISLGGDRMSSAESSNFLRIIIWALAMTAFYTWLGWNLIKDGRFLFQILNREEPPPVLKDFKKDSINLSDKQNL